MICKNCGVQLNANAKFCWKCGVKAQTIKTASSGICTECGCVLPAESSFCHHCGAQTTAGNQDRESASHSSFNANLIRFGIAILAFLGLAVGITSPFISASLLGANISYSIPGLGDIVNKIFGLGSMFGIGNEMSGIIAIINGMVAVFIITYIVAAIGGFLALIKRNKIDLFIIPVIIISVFGIIFSYNAGGGSSTNDIFTKSMGISCGLDAGFFVPLVFYCICIGLMFFQNIKIRYK